MSSINARKQTQTHIQHTAITSIYNVATRPELSRAAMGLINLRYTRHAFVRAAERDLDMPEQLNVVAGTVVEIEVTDNKLSKVIVRMHGDSGQDQCWVIVPESAHVWAVLSMYANDEHDNHATLNLERISV